MSDQSADGVEQVYVVMEDGHPARVFEDQDAADSWALSEFGEWGTVVYAGVPYHPQAEEA